MKNLLNRKIFIIIIMILAISLCILMMILNYLNLKNQRIETIKATGEFTSIRDILEYYDCEYIKEEKSEEENFELDIYTKFKYDLYDGEESNEEFYNKVINKIADFINYKSFRMIDESKEEKIDIKVICDGKKIRKILINDIEDYFMYMDSQFDVKKYKKIVETEFVVQSPELLQCIENDWDKSIDFGQRESIFQNYNIYFDEGIMVRIISGRVYNVVFSNKYEGNVINDLNSSTKYDIIVSKLGNPTFKNEDKSIIGYKGKDMYVFFGNNEISVYRNTVEEYDDFFRLVDDYLDEQYTFTEFMNKLTDTWKDYETYEYSEDSVFMSFPNKGIDIKLNYENVDGIVLYNNIGVEQNVVKKYLNSTYFISNMKIDNIYLAEQRRIARAKNLENLCDEYQKEYEAEDDRNRENVYKYYMDFDSNKNIQAVYFISKSTNYYNNQLIENINDYIWINDTTFVYSKRKRGIYAFDLATGEKSVILTGKDTYEIISYEDGVLNYDESFINL